MELSDGVIEWGSVGADGGADGRRRGRAGAWVTFGLWAGGGRDGGHSSRCGAALSEGVSADDWGRSAEGPRRCMGYLWIVGGRRAGRMSFVTFWGGSLVVDGARVFSIILIYPLAGRRGARRCRRCHPRRGAEGRPGQEDVGGQLWSPQWRPSGSREDR